jgi:hypothetical protein
MPRREERGHLRPLNHGATRVRREAVADNPDDKRTWTEEQRWDGMKMKAIEDIYRNAGVTKRRRMRQYFRRTSNTKKLRLAQAIEKEG